MKTLAERIADAEKALVVKKDELVAAANLLEAAPDEESLLAQVQELNIQVEKGTESLEALKKAESVLAARAVPVAAPATITARKDAKGDGSLLWKMATANLVAHVQRKSAAEVIADRYADDNRVAAAYDYVSKSVVNPAMTSTAGWAQELVQSDVQGFLNSLRANSVAAELASKSQTLSFGGYDSITVPMRNALGATLSEPAWVN
jgi:hypothetical protein